MEEQMAKNKKQTDAFAEVKAIGEVHSALRDLQSPAQLRVLRYCAEMLGLALDLTPKNIGGSGTGNEISQEVDSAPATAAAAPDTKVPEDVDGINSVALKWIRRSGLSTQALQRLFSLGIDEIDLVAESVPGGTKKDRMRNILLLKGIAAYLSAGAPRITFEQLKEACLHYDAYDVSNFAAYLKSFAAEVNGTKEAGFTLTARGITAATSLIREMLGHA
jgi:hypothetical protein